jgi:hypothetical protein
MSDNGESCADNVAERGKGECIVPKADQWDTIANLGFHEPALRLPLPACTIVRLCYNSS